MMTLNKIERFNTMLITRASEYAVLSLILLSSEKEPMDSETLSRELSISKSFLAKILQALAKNNILKSYKGVNGGFILNKDPKNINMLEVMQCVEGKGPAVFECSPSQNDCPSDRANICSIWPFLHKLQGKIDLFLANLTLADVLVD
jgi:Rrf2 family protein